MTKKTEEWWLQRLEDLREMKGADFAEKHGVHLSTVRNQRRLRGLTGTPQKNAVVVSSAVRKKYKLYPEKIWNYMQADLAQLTIVEFCQKYDVSKSTVTAKRKHYNVIVTARKGRELNARIKDLIIGDLRAGHDQTDVAKRHGVSLHTVHRIARENSITGKRGCRHKKSTW